MGRLPNQSFEQAKYKSPRQQQELARAQKDAELTLLAQNALLLFADMANDDIGIKVNHGWITLCGQVDWEYQRLAAVDALKVVRDVAGISDEITVRPWTP